MLPKQQKQPPTPQKPPQQFQYEQTTPLQLHELVKSLLVCSKNSTPHFPPLFTKKICENEGLECNQNVFFQLMANIVDFKLSQCIGEIKENIGAGVSKKQVKDLTLKTVDVEKFFLDKEVKFARPRVYSQIQTNMNQEDTLMPDASVRNL